MTPKDTKDNMKRAYRLAVGMLGERLILQPEGLGRVVGVRLAGRADDGVTVQLDTGAVLDVTFSRLAGLTVPGLLLPPEPPGPVPQAAPQPEPVAGVSVRPAGPAGPPVDPGQVEDAVGVLTKLGIKPAEARESVSRALRSGCRPATQDIVTWVYRHR